MLLLRINEHGKWPGRLTAAATNSPALRCSALPYLHAHCQPCIIYMPTGTRLQATYDTIKKAYKAVWAQQNVQRAALWLPA